MNTTESKPAWTRARLARLGILSLAWLAAAYAIGTGHWLTNDRQLLIPPIASTAIVPVIVFLAAYGISRRFRAFVLAQDIRLLTMAQLGRVVGFAFLALYAFDALPGLFAWPAGVGDIAIGLTAFFVVNRLDRDPDFATSAGLVRFHLFGLLDFAVAIVAAGLTTGAFPGLTPGGFTSAAMDVWPLNVFPSVIVPAFVILHLTVLLKVRHLRRRADAPVNAALKAA